MTREPDFRWAGRPVYRCRVCGDRFERVDNLDAVLLHEATHQVTRVSPILGPAGETLIIQGSKA